MANSRQKPPDDDEPPPKKGSEEAERERRRTAGEAVARLMEYEPEFKRPARFVRVEAFLLWPEHYRVNVMVECPSNEDKGNFYKDLRIHQSWFVLSNGKEIFRIL